MGWTPTLGYKSYCGPAVMETLLILLLFLLFMLVDPADDGAEKTKDEDDYHYQQFLQQQRKRESDWEMERQKIQLRKKKKLDHYFNSTCEISDASTQTDTDIGLQGIITECELLKNRVNEVDEKAALAINMLKVTVYIYFPSDQACKLSFHRNWSHVSVSQIELSSFYYSREN